VSMLTNRWHGSEPNDARGDMIDRAERAERIARAKALRVVAIETKAAARKLCHTARNLCQTAVLRQALDNRLRLPGITRPR
jgi:hypothetical protein